MASVRFTLNAIATLVATLACVVIAESATTAFPRPLDILKVVADEPPPTPGLGYVSAGSGGAFTLAGKQGHAAFRWNHSLDVDWHDHPTQYIGTAVDRDNNKYWVYTARYEHDGHVDKVWLYFAQSKVPDDSGFRIFFGHADVDQGQPEPNEPAPHDIHVWCTDAARFGHHAAPEADRPIAPVRFKMLFSR